MQVEVGKLYKARDGKIVKVISEFKSKEFDFETDKHYFVAANGRYEGKCPTYPLDSIYDLVEEVIEDNVSAYPNSDLTIDDMLAIDEASGNLTMPLTPIDNQHKHIKGYRDLSKEEIDMMNTAKELAEQIREYCDNLEGTHKNGILSVDMRWLNIARTDLQKGFMSLIRSIAQPTTF